MRELETNGGQAEWQITCLPFLHISSATLSSHAHVLSLTYSYENIHKLSSKVSFSHPYPFSSSFFSSSYSLISSVEWVQGEIWKQLDSSWYEKVEASSNVSWFWGGKEIQTTWETLETPLFLDFTEGKCKSSYEKEQPSAMRNRLLFLIVTFSRPALV